MVLVAKSQIKTEWNRQKHIIIIVDIISAYRKKSFNWKGNLLHFNKQTDFLTLKICFGFTIVEIEKMRKNIEKKKSKLHVVNSEQ